MTPNILPNPIRAICVDRGRDLAHQFAHALDPHPVELAYERTLSEVLDRFEEAHFDVLLFSSLAIRGNEQEAMELLELINAKCPMTQVLFFVPPDQMQSALHAMRAGSFLYTKLPVSDHELRVLVETAMARRPTAGANLMLRKGVHETGFERMIGRSSAMQAVYRRIRQAAATDIPVLLTGETGSGKELAAHAIYEQSQRSSAPYVPVHLSALPSDLVADELVGHEKGAYTHAMSRKPGCLERADGGTVFLDEISSMDAKMQVSLLRVLEQQRFTRIGGQEPVSVDVRIIAATNESLQHLVQTGGFREDLFYRLDVMHIELPPLRERHGDVPLLVEHFLRQSNADFNKSIQGLEPEVLARMERYDWPGNVRELKNVIQRAVVLCEGNILTPRQLPRRLLDESTVERSIPIKIGIPLAEVERDVIRATLQYTGYHRSRTAAVLGISRRALYNKIRRYNLSLGRTIASGGDPFMEEE